MTTPCPVCGRLLDSCWGRAPHLMMHARRGELVARLVWADGSPMTPAEKTLGPGGPLTRWAFSLPEREMEA